MSNRAGISLRDDEIGEYLDNGNLSDVSGLDFDADLDDEVDLCCDIGPSVQEVLVPSQSNTPVEVQYNVSIPSAITTNTSDIGVEFEPDLSIPSTSTANISGVDFFPGPSGDVPHNPRPRPRPRFFCS